MFRTFWPLASADTFELRMDLKRAVASGHPNAATARPVFMMQRAE
jgi:hypothetical protein